MPADQPLPTIPGYEVLRKLGQGGMGVVYEAKRRADELRVALKMIVGARPEHVLRFRREAQAVSRLRHPNIVQLYDTGECQGLPYFTMELVLGGSLADRRHTLPLPAGSAANIVEVLARAINYAHGQGIIHRDLTPANVLLTLAGKPKISDFGLAKCLEDESDLTSSGRIMGTPGYLAPELAWGKTKDAGPAVDVYALGAILYELLTGQPPFRGPLMDILDQVRFEPPRRPTSLRPEVPTDLELICLKCLFKKPEQRYTTAEALADELRRFGEGKPVQTQPPPIPAEADDQSHREVLPEVGAEGGSSPPTRPWSGSRGVKGSRISPPPNYELLEEICTEPLAMVYKARQISLNRIIAYKVHCRGWWGGQEAHKRLDMEAALLSRFQHPNIVQIFDYGEYDDQTYLALEFLEGGSLSQRITGHPQSARQVAQVIQALALTMDYVHKHNFVHGHLTPHVVIFSTTGNPKITQFSLGRSPQLGMDDLASGKSRILGSPCYMAPEQLRGGFVGSPTLSIGGVIGPSADVYALGAILYEMLTGRPPFRGPTTRELAHFLDEIVWKKEPERPRSINPRVGRRLEAICLKCLQKDPAHRQQSASELADDLGRYLRSWFG
jgi:serine/threonine protein kinase